MIQRIQTVFLLVGAIACAAPLVLGTAPLADDAGAWVGMLRIGLFALAALLGVVAIFLFNKREIQSTLVLWAQLAAVLAFLFLLVSGLLYAVDGAGVQSLVSSGATAVATLAPGAGVVLYQLARRAVRADIKLVKSMDRLRD